MAKKTNKTSHVLNLITNGEPEVSQETPKPAPAPAPVSVPEPVPVPVEKKASEPKVTVVNADQENDEVSEEIQRQLLSQLEAERKEAEQAEMAANAASAAAPVAAVPVQEPVMAAAPVSAAPQPSVEVPAAVPVQAAPAASEPVPAAPVASPEPAAVASTAAPISAAPVASPELAAAAQEPTAAAQEPVVTPTAPAASESVSAEPVAASVSASAPVSDGTVSMSAPVRIQPQKKEEHPGYDMVNVMEQILKRTKVSKYMQDYGVCTCSRCHADVLALVLTRLPAKYVVVDDTAISPMISYYESRYRMRILTEMIKSCIDVRDNPRH